MAGGDLGRGTEISVTVAVLGTLEGGKPVLRSGARPGDVLALAGTVGRAAAGLALLESATPMQALHPAQRALVETQCRPAAAPAAGPLARSAGATAMMDISDGLVRDGGRLAAASGVVLDLDPLELKRQAEGLSPASDVLGSGPAGVGAGRGRGPRTACHIPCQRSASGRIHCDRLSTSPGNRHWPGRHNCGPRRWRQGMGSLCRLRLPRMPKR